MQCPIHLAMCSHLLVILRATDQQNNCKPKIPALLLSRLFSIIKCDKITTMWPEDCMSWPDINTTETNTANHTYTLSDKSLLTKGAEKWGRGAGEGRGEEGEKEPFWCSITDHELLTQTWDKRTISLYRLKRGKIPQSLKLHLLERKGM